MLMPNRHYPHLSYVVINDIAKIIENNLRYDWIIRIEYTDKVECLNTIWHQWGKTFFKVKSIEEIMDNIITCHINNQLCSIRLYAEKTRPESKLYYSVCQACHVSDPDDKNTS